MAVNPLRLLSHLLLNPQSAPTSPVAGVLYADSGDSTLNLHDGSRFRKQVGLPYVLANTNNATLSVNTAYYIGSSVSTLNLPSSASAGDTIELIKSASASVTINSTITIDTDRGSATAINFDVSADIKFIYDSSTSHWRLNYIGQNGGTSSAGIPYWQQIICSASQSSATFSSIPTTGSDLKLTITGRDTSTTVADSPIYIQINGDTTSSNYTNTRQEVYGTNTSVGADRANGSSNGAPVGSLPGTLNNSNAVGSTEITFVGYRSGFYKKFQSLSGSYANSSDAQTMSMCTAVYKSTSPIGSIKVTPGGSAFTNGTVLTMYVLG